MNVKNHLPVNMAVLYTGLKNNWLTPKEVAALVNEHFETLNCDEKTLLEINIHDDNRTILLELLHSQVTDEDDSGIRSWQLAFLMAIEQSELSIHEKLREVELQWARFDYPESWRDFIYYLSNEKSNNEADVYRNFLSFLQKTS